MRPPLRPVHPPRRRRHRDRGERHQPVGRAEAAAIAGQGGLLASGPLPAGRPALGGGHARREAPLRQGVRLSDGGAQGKDQVGKKKKILNNVHDIVIVIVQRRICERHVMKTHSKY